MAYDLKLGDDGDLVFEDGDLVLFSGPSCVAQGVYLALGIVRGEYVYDTDYGVPLIGVDAQGNPLSTYLTDETISESQRHAFVLSYLQQIEGVSSVQSLILDADKAKRVLYIYASLLTKDGPTDIKYGVSSRV